MPNLNRPMFYAEADHVLNVVKKEPYAADDCACGGACKEGEKDQARKLAAPLKYGQGQPCKKGETSSKSGCTPSSGEPKNESTAGWLNRAASGLVKGMDWLSGRSEGNDWKRKMHPPMKGGGKPKPQEDVEHGGDHGWGW